MIFPISSDDSF